MVDQSVSKHDVLIELNGIAKCYPKLRTSGDRVTALWQVLLGKEVSRQHQILNDISFDLHRGESLGIIGENGAGKSTLLKIIAGVINPPAANKYYYLVNEKQPDNLEEWFSRADEHHGSWWPDWHRWLYRRSGKKVPARIPGDGRLKPIEDAPGSYVKMR